eukprot:scaffold3.g6312.t1
MQASGARQLSRVLNCALYASGFVCTPLSLKWYNDAIPAELGARIPPQGKAGKEALVVLIANSKQIWEPFLSAAASDPHLLASSDPLDTYICRLVEAALDYCVEGRYPAELEGSDFVAFQRMAHAAALAHLDERCHLCLHPKFGSWISLRACVVFDDVQLAAPAPAPLPNPLDNKPTVQRYVQVALLSAVHSTSRKWQLEGADVEAAAATLLDAGNEEAHAGPAGEGAAEAAAAAVGGEEGGVPRGADAGGGGGGAEGGDEGALGRRCSADSPARSSEYPSMTAVRDNWRTWLAVRDAPCPGHPW